jgi:Ax21 family sulfation-dependent quorum factor
MKRSLIALGLLAALPFAASASDLSYNYVEGGYTRINGLGTKVDGAAINGSIALGSRFHVFGGYETIEFPGQNVSIGNGTTVNTFDVDADNWNLGFGYNHSLSQSTDLVARLGYRDWDFDNPFGGSGHSFKSYFTEVGARSQLMPNLEGYLYAGYEKTEGSGQSGDYYGRLGGQYNFNKSWGLVADAKFGSGAEQYFFGPRFSF